MKYDIGDRVYVRTNLSVFPKQRQKYRSALATITEVDSVCGIYRLDIDGGKFWWSDSMLTYIPDEVLANAFQEPTEDTSTEDTSVEMVDHPQHYNSHGKYETIEKMRMLFGDEAVKTWIKLTVFKYMDRVGHKDAEKQEWGKVDWYLDYLKKMESEEK